VGCRRSARRDELVRLVRAAEGAVRLDPVGSAPGRGAYLCRDRACLTRARRRLAGALRAERMDFSEIERLFPVAAGIS
jgi:predicted RNA-binding protein YlxR (DUF448 family)